MRAYINWKIFAILLSLSLLSVVSIFPYILSIQGELLRSLGKPMGLIFFAQVVQSMVLFSLFIFFGLFFTKKINFKLPLIEAILEKGNWKEVLRNILGKSVFIGIVIAAVIFFLDPLFTAAGTTISTHQDLAPLWQKLLAAIYGGTVEEIVMRLFLMTFFIWIGMKIFKLSEPTNAIVIISMILAAIVFGLGHLPITASVTKIDSLVITRAIILNGIAGVVFGWLFWKKGLESAIIAHFTADIFLLSLLPLLF